MPEQQDRKNRVHLDVNAAAAGLRRGAERWCTSAREAERLVTLGATRLREMRAAPCAAWVVLPDPDGNEFCLE